MPKAIWNDAVIAQTERFETVEGNVYFPPEAVRMECLRPSETHTICSWKGMASYFSAARLLRYLAPGCFPSNSPSRPARSNAVRSSNPPT